MTPVFFLKRAIGAAAFAAAILGGNVAAAGPKHGIAMYGEPALPPDFVALPYANPEAPKGGDVAFANTGGFDSLNPYVQNGNVPWQLRFWGVESLMGRSWDEPFSLYGLLAESIETDEARSWVEFTLRPGYDLKIAIQIGIDQILFTNWNKEELNKVENGHFVTSSTTCPSDCW